MQLPVWPWYWQLVPSSRVVDMVALLLWILNTPVSAQSSLQGPAIKGTTVPVGIGSSIWQVAFAWGSADGRTHFLPAHTYSWFCPPQLTRLFNMMYLQTEISRGISPLLYQCLVSVHVAAFMMPGGTATAAQSFGLARVAAPRERIGGWNFDGGFWKPLLRMERLADYRPSASFELLLVESLACPHEVHPYYHSVSRSNVDGVRA